MAITCAVLLFMVYDIFISSEESRVMIGENLKVHTPPYAREIVQREEQDLRPKIRTGGTALGGYRVGNFKLANGRSALIMANDTRVVAIELEDKYLLLAPDDFERFVIELNDRFVPVN